MSPDDIRFCDLKSRYSRLFSRLGYRKNDIFTQFGNTPGEISHISLSGHPLVVETINLLDAEFFSTTAGLEDEDVYDAGRELVDIVYYKFPFEAFRSQTPFPIGFLKEVTIRANLLALVAADDIAQRKERELLRLSEGSILWNTRLIQSTVPRDEIREGMFGYRFVVAFNHPSYGFIDFDGARAGKISSDWASRMVRLRGRK